MPFTVSMDAGPCLLVTATGRARLSELAGLATFVAEVTNRRGIKRVLANLAAVEPELCFTDHLQLGVQGSSVLGQLERLAVVVPPGYLDAPSARAAQLTGLKLRTFLEFDEALAWLEDLPPPVLLRPAC